MLCKHCNQMTSDDARYCNSCSKALKFATQNRENESRPAIVLLLTVAIVLLTHGAAAMAAAALPHLFTTTSLVCKASVMERNYYRTFIVYTVYFDGIKTTKQDAFLEYTFSTPDGTKFFPVHNSRSSTIYRDGRLLVEDVAPGKEVASSASVVRNLWFRGTTVDERHRIAQAVFSEPTAGCVTLTKATALVIRHPLDRMATEIAGNVTGQITAPCEWDDPENPRFTFPGPKRPRLIRWNASYDVLPPTYDIASMQCTASIVPNTLVEPEDTDSSMVKYTISLKGVRLINNAWPYQSNGIIYEVIAPNGVPACQQHLDVRGQAAFVSEQGPIGKRGTKYDDYQMGCPIDNSWLGINGQTYSWEVEQIEKYPNAGTVNILAGGGGVTSATCLWKRP